jgi:SAM-dependent methyltransferase
MMGTDQRDLFVPELRRVAAEVVPSGGRILDAGCGDGQTFALMADAVAAGTVVDFADPNPEYVARYRQMIGAHPALEAGCGVVAGFDDLEAAARREGVAPPQAASFDLVLAIHMIYFLPEPERALAAMVRLLRPGGALVAVVADETTGYTGRALAAYAERRPGDGTLAGHLDAIAVRHRLLGPQGDLARRLDVEAEVELLRQPSRLYGHSLADLVALSTIAALAEVEDTAKFEAATALLRDHPELVDLRIEDDGPRLGMLSVAQPQTIAIVRRRR